MNKPETTADAPKSSSRGSILKLGCLLTVFGLFVFGVWFLSLVLAAREAARRNSCIGKLSQLSLALHIYADVYGELPPAYTVDAEGKPLHSWRTLILPYMEEQQLYKSIDLSRPWDDPVNQKALHTPLSWYRCPSADLAENQTTYLAIIAPDSCMQPGRSRKLSDIPDGASNTLLVIEVPVDQAVFWMEPRDADERMFVAMNASSRLAHPDGFVAVFAEGRIKLLPADLPTATRRALITIDGGEPIADRDLE